jgi:hypothetical protein
MHQSEKTYFSWNGQAGPWSFCQFHYGNHTLLVVRKILVLVDSDTAKVSRPADESSVEIKDCSTSEVLLAREREEEEEEEGGMDGVTFFYTCYT